VKHCAKWTADPAKHRGPFTVLFVLENDLEYTSAESCKACGNTVLRALPPADEDKGKAGAAPRR
jgi:hypothetical protein